MHFIHNALRTLSVHSWPIVQNNQATMYKSTLAICLLISSAIAFAAPRAVLPEEGQIEFVVKEMGVPVSGKFKRFDAAIDIDATKMEKSSVNIRIDIGSLTTGSDEADSLAVGPDWLDKARAPYANFKSAAIRELGKGRYEVKGTLNIHGKERELLIQFNSTDQASGKTIVTSEFVIKREDFNIGAGLWNEVDVVSPEILVKVRLALLPPAAKSSTVSSR
jgi:polyisoprenoid-binding protein YceI